MRRESERARSLRTRISTDPTQKQYVLDRVEVDPESGCWIWTKSIHPGTGYGQVGFRPYTAHRLAYLLWVGPTTLPVLRHQCHVRPCCNPAHLLEGTYADNYEDSRETYEPATSARRGVVARNAVKVVVEGVEYASHVHAMKALHVSFKTLKRISTSE